LFNAAATIISTDAGIAIVIIDLQQDRAKRITDASSNLRVRCDAFHALIQTDKNHQIAELRQKDMFVDLANEMTVIRFPRNNARLSMYHSEKRKLLAGGSGRELDVTSRLVSKHTELELKSDVK
jgi:hypothetical protein